MSHGDQRAKFIVTLGYYDDGAVGEVFITGQKTGTQMDAISRDSAVLLSIALQHGVPLKTMQHAITREPDGTASTITGSVIDKLKHEKEEL